MAELAEQKPHVALINKLLALRQELNDYKETIKSLKKTNPGDSIRDVLVAFRDVKKEVDEIEGELSLIEFQKGTNARATLEQYQEDPRYPEMDKQLMDVGYGGRKTRKHRKRRKSRR